MPENSIASSNPALQQNGAATTAPATAAPAAPRPQAETTTAAANASTVHISNEATQRFNSERSASSGAVPTELTGEVTPAEAPQAANAATATQAPPPQAPTAPVDNGQGLGQLMDLYA